MSNIHHIEDFSQKKEDVFLFDTNILIKIFYPTMGTRNSPPYINLYQKIQKVGATVLISGIQISEFVNTCIRFQFGLFKNENPTLIDFKKDYRSTDDYKLYMTAILDLIGDMMSLFECIDDEFNKMDKSNLMKYGYAYDFNDSYLAELSRINDSILVTEDGDFSSFSNKIPIVTNNRHLLLFQQKR